MLICALFSYIERVMLDLDVPRKSLA